MKSLSLILLGLLASCGARPPRSSLVDNGDPPKTGHEEAKPVLDQDPVSDGINHPQFDVPTAVLGLECEKPEKIGNKVICQTKVEGIAVKFIPLEDNAQAKRLAVYFHGDQAVDWQDPYNIEPIVSWAERQKVVIVMPLSPAKYANDPVDEPSFGAAKSSDAEKIGRVVESFVKTFQTPSDNLLYMAISGGSWFATSSYIPLMAGRYPGLFALNCGASTFWNEFDWDMRNEGLRGKSKVFFNYGEWDFLREGEEKSYEFFQKQGITVSKKIHKGAVHCEHDIRDATLQFFNSQMQN